jgi:hypothetical protein
MLYKILIFGRKEFTYKDSQILFHVNEAARLVEEIYKIDENERERILKLK